MSGKKRAKIEQRAFDYFQSGFNCAEAISKAIVEAFSNEISTDIPEVATGFGGGIGGSKAETCGALNGGIIAVGCLFGRKQPKDDKKTTYEIGAEFRQKFIQSFGSSTCRNILEGFGEQENLIECKKLTGRAAGILYAMIEDIVPEKSSEV
jgi:C_GCAxxG_C_C family probable redox protein